MQLKPTKPSGPSGQSDLFLKIFGEAGRVRIKEMETRLFGAILVASPDPIYVLDLEGRFIYANKATAELFAMKSDAIVGKSNFELGFSFASDFQRKQEKVIAAQSTYRGKFAHKTSQQPVQVSVSIGISFYPQDAFSPVALLETADQAMYRAKTSGSNKMHFPDESGKTER